MNIRFGEFELDRGRGTVTGPAGPVSLRPQTFRLLETLLDHAPDLVDRNAVLDEVWGHGHLSPNVVPQAISELRQALGDNAQTPRYIQTVHRRGYRMVCSVEQIDKTAVLTREPSGQQAASVNSTSRFYRPRAGALALVTTLVLGLALIGLLASLDRPKDSPEILSQAGFERAIIALTTFPAQDAVPEWLPAAALELLTPLLASDDRVLVLRGENLGLDALPAGARWQHAMRELIGAPAAITGYWRLSGNELRLDYNLIELDSGRQLHGGQLLGSIDELDGMVTRVADDLRSALDLPTLSAPGGWHMISQDQRRQYWLALADLGRGNHHDAAERMLQLYHQLNRPTWLAPVTARALRLSGQPHPAREILASAMDSPDILRGLGTSLRLRAELARLDNDPAGAAAALRALTALFPDEADLLLELANAELDALDGESARRTMARLQEHRLLEHDPRLKLLRARMARLDGNIEQAAALAASALADAEHHELPGLASVAVLALAEFSEAGGDLALASSQLEHFLTQWQDRLAPDQIFAIGLRQTSLDRMRGQFETAIARLASIEEEHGNDDRLLRLTIERALIDSERGHFDAAEASLDTIEALIHQRSDPELGVAYFSARGRIAAEQGRAESARADFSQAVTLARRSGRAHHLAGLQVNAGLMLARQRRFEEADKLWEEALEVFEQIGDRRGVALALSNLAASAASRGMAQRGTELNHRALELFRQLDMNSHIARTSYNLGLLARRQGRFRDAAELLNEASRSYLASGSLTLAVAASSRQADALTALGHYRDADRILSASKAHLGQATNLHRGDWHATKARLLRWTGDVDGARQALIKARELRQLSGSDDWLVISELERLEVELLDGTNPSDLLLESEKQLRRVIPLNQPRLQAQALAMVAEALLMQQRYEEARIQIREARAALSGMPDVLVELRLDWLEAWAADEPDRRQRLQDLAQLADSLELDSRVQLVERVLDPQQATSVNHSIPIPGYAINEHSALP